MPFREIERGKQVKSIRITETWIYISRDLYDEFFSGKRVKVFIDSENGIIGLQPSEEGYKISQHKRFWSTELSDLTLGTLILKEWSKEYGMLLFQIPNTVCIQP